MVPLLELSRAHRQAHSLNALINPYGFVDGSAFIQKDGNVGVVLRLFLPDAEGKDPERLEADISQIAAALKAFGEDFIVSQWTTKRAHPLLASTTYENRVLADTIQRHHAFILEKGSSLYAIETHLIVTCKSKWASPRVADRFIHFLKHPRAVARRTLSLNGSVLFINETLEDSLKRLHYAVNSFLGQLPAEVTGKRLKKDEAFSFIRRIINLNPEKASAIPLTQDAHIDYFAVDSALECQRDHVRVDDYFVKPLTLKIPPRQTAANLLKELYRIQAEMIIVTQWSRWDSARAIALIQSKRRHWNNTKTSLLNHIGSEKPYERELLFDDSKEALTQSLGQCLEAMRIDGHEIGEFSLTVLPVGKTLEAVERAAAEVMRVFGAHEGSLNEERYNGLNAYLAALPGGYPYDLRRILITNRNHADLSLWFAPAEGERRNDFLGREYLIPLETEDRTLFYFNLHFGDVGHTLMVGPTGTGKSFALNVLITHAQKYLPYTFIFGLSPDYRCIVEQFGGSYVAVNPDRVPFKINPFVLEPTPENLQFLFAFGKLLIESGGFKMSDFDDRDLFESIRALYVLDPEQRRLLTLSNTVDRKLGEHLRRWTEGEQHGSWFDHPHDTVTFSRFQYVDFEGMESLGAVLEPLLFYLLHRANDIIYDPALSTVFKLFVFDEAWRFMKHPVTRAYITEALKTWRKKNAAMMLATQSLHDLSSMEVLRPVVESCPTKLLLANPTRDPNLYGEVLGLTKTEQEQVQRLIPKRQFLLKRENLSKVLNLHVDPRSYWLFTTNPFEAKRRQEAIERLGLQGALDELEGGSL